MVMASFDTGNLQFLNFIRSHAAQVTIEISFYSLLLFKPILVLDLTLNINARITPTKTTDSVKNKEEKVSKNSLKIVVVDDHKFDVDVDGLTAGCSSLGCLRGSVLRSD